MLGRIVKLALNDLRLTMRDRPAFFWLLVFPVFLMWMFGRMSGGGDVGPPRISLTVIDEDGGWLARAFVEELQDESVNLTEMTREAYDTAENKVRSLVIPAGFSDGVLAGEQQTLYFEKQAGSNQEFGLAGQAHVVRVIARTISRLVELDPADGNDPAIAEAFRALRERPAPVTLAVSTAGAGTPVPRGYAQSVPGTLTMIVLMMTLIYGAVFLTIEKTEGMLRRQVSLPLSRRQIYLGKLVGRLLIAGIQIVVLLLAGRFLFDVSFGSSWAGLLMVLVSYAVAVAGLATLLGAVLQTPQQASVIGWLASMVMAGLGGCWWPAEVMPEWMRDASHALPTAWAMDGFHALISFGRGAEAVVLPAAALLGFGVLFAVLGARFLRFD